MNQKVTFEWTPELAKSAGKTLCNRKFGHTRFLLLAGLAIFVIATCDYFLRSQKNALTAVGAVSGLFMFIVSLRILLHGHRYIRDYFEFVDDPMVTVTIAEDSITITCNKSAGTIGWQKITDMKEWDGLIFLFAGKLIVSMLPRQALTDDQVEYMRSKIMA